MLSPFRQVLRLITSSYLVGACTGRSAGFAFRRPIWLFMNYSASQPAIPPKMMAAIQPTCCRGNRMLEMTNENFARLLRGLTIAVGNRRNRILLYQFLAAEIRALHCSYGVGDGESYKRALTFLENCERYTLRSLVRRSAKHHAEATVDHAKRIFSRALKKLDTSHGDNPTLRAMIVHLLKQEPLQTNSQASGNI
jgi:hypothetical protein